MARPLLLMVIFLGSVFFIKNLFAATKGTFVVRNDNQLMFDDQPYRFTGVNAYEAATYWGNNYGCGQKITDIDGFFGSLTPNTVVRMWAWQGTMAVNPTTKQLDWTGIDRTLAAAEKAGVKVILSLGSQSGSCDDGHWKDKVWYDGGYDSVYNDGVDAGTKRYTVLSYLDYVRAIVSRYKNRPVIAMWEPINEPEVSSCAPGYSEDGCYGHLSCIDKTAASQSLRNFFDKIGGEIKRIDTNHLVESGVIGSGQCGADGTRYQYVHESPVIDVASYHDYGHDDELIPGDQWNGLRARLNQAASINKPLIIGEVGIKAQASLADCMTFTQRRDKMKAKMDAQFPAGIQGFLIWNWWKDNQPSACAYETMTFGDPAIDLLNNYFPSLTPTPSPENTSTLAPLDSVSPFVAITYPLDSSFVPRNKYITITIDASDDVEVTKVDILVNGKLVCRDEANPYSCPWKVPGAQDKVYTIAARAFNANQNSTITKIKVTSK